ncbi:hypothetical protein MHZ95_05165 [Sporosarcina sp. ACRSM]|uniref:CBO0543 family protein n=1 Tax=Sporosarcina sp. ACRSM TaxID=2918216 RepID=UPI001EF592F6|nr:hypothetical protein [Sporosarcina sp. ACRSM]
MKHLKSSNLRQSPKRRFSRNVLLYLPALVVACLLGTYLDLIFVGINMYSFPVRPFPDIFSINIAFTLLILPFYTWLFLFIIDNMPKWGRLVFIFLLAIFAAIIEKLAVQWGFFSHTDQWNSSYSLVGYFLFLILMWKIFNWSKGRIGN